MTENKTISGNGIPIHRRLGQIHRDPEDRNDVEIEYTKQNFAKPSSHGSKAKFNISDNHSLYRTVERFATSRGINSNGGPHIVEGYTTDLLRGGCLNVKISSSNWSGGFGTGDDFSPLQKYHITVRPRDDQGQTIEKTPLDALSLTIHPQIPGLISSSGRPMTYPYPGTTLVYVDTTHVRSADEFIHRANDLLEFVFDYEIASDDVIDGSGGIMKLEMYHRINKKCESVIKSVLQDSCSLLDDQIGLHQRSELEFSSRYWHRLGFPQYSHGINAKLYYANISANTGGPLKHLKFETQFVRLDSQNKLPSFDEFDMIQHNLTEILNSHLIWATIGGADLVADRVYDGRNQPTCSWEHPANSREVLKETALTMYSEVWHQINNNRTTAPKDILWTLVKDTYSLQTYDDLVDATGLVRSTIRKHVKNLEEKGIITRIRSHETMINCKNQYIAEVVIKALNDAFPEETVEEINQRAEENKQRRNNSTYLKGTDSSGSGETISESSAEQGNDGFNSFTGSAQTDGGKKQS